MPVIGRKVRLGSVAHVDEASAYGVPHARYSVKWINHKEAYSRDGACTNGAERYFSRMRRERGAAREGEEAICKIAQYRICIYASTVVG